MIRLLPLLGVLALTACAKLPPQQCTATAFIGNQDTSIPIYGVKQVGHQTQYYAGGPFGWRWVSKTQFKSSTCPK